MYIKEQKIGVIRLYRAKNLIAAMLALALLTLILASGYMVFTRNSIVGVVYAEGNVPVAGATVTVVGPNASGVGKTDSTGKYDITSGLGTGTCSVTVTARGYLDKTVTVQVVAGSTITVPGIFLKRSGVISGAVFSVGPVTRPPPPADQEGGWARRLHQPSKAS